VPRLEESGLRSLATAGGGRFAVLSTDDRDLDYLLSGATTGGRQAGDENLATDHWREEGPWLLLVLLPLAALAFRRGYVLGALLLIVMPFGNEAEALTWKDLWQTPDQQAQSLLQEGAAAEAVELFEDDEWRAVAQYRAENYTASAATFADREDTRSLYNLGNAMARQGEFESAIDAYEQVLELEPDNEDAAYNRDLLQQLQEQQQQNEGDQQESSEQEGDGEQSESSQSQEQSADSESQSDGESQEGDASQREQEGSEEDLEALQEELQRAAEEAAQQEQEMAQQQLTPEELEALRREQEQQQAMEQWLRRIPNDPGGLLRRKFRYQYQKTGKDQDGNNTWPDDEVQPW
jgi:Ca-activated chloride channel family protein